MFDNVFFSSFFLLFLCGEIQKSKYHSNMGPPAWRADGGPTLKAGLVTVNFQGSGPVLLRNPISF